MPLTDVQVRNLNGGQKPVKSSNEKSGQPKVSKPKNTTKGAGATLAKTDDGSKFIVTTKPYKMETERGSIWRLILRAETIGDSTTDVQEKRSGSGWGYTPKWAWRMLGRQRTNAASSWHGA